MYWVITFYEKINKIKLKKLASIFRNYTMESHCARRSRSVTCLAVNTVSAIYDSGGDVSQHDALYLLNGDISITIESFVADERV